MILSHWDLTLAITWPQRDQLNIANRLEAAQVHGIVMPNMTECQRLATGQAMPGMPMNVYNSSWFIWSKTGILFCISLCLPYRLLRGDHKFLISFGDKLPT